MFFRTFLVKTYDKSLCVEHQRMLFFTRHNWLSVSTKFTHAINYWGVRSFGPLRISLVRNTTYFDYSAPWSRTGRVYCKYSIINICSSPRPAPNKPTPLISENDRDCGHENIYNERLSCRLFVFAVFSSVLKSAIWNINLKLIVIFVLSINWDSIVKIFF